MGVLGVVGGLFSLIGSGVSAFFGFKGEQAKTVNRALEVISNVNSSSGQREAAIAQIIASESTSGYWLAAVWRPMTMVIFLAMLIAFWFGYIPPHLDGPMPPMVAELFSLIKLGIGGYMGARTIEKVVGQMNVGKILQKFVEKKLV